MTKRILSLVALVGLVAILSGCVAGYNSLLFVTKTNVGFEVDTQPPRISLDIGRFEGLLSPSYEDGKTPPVLAAFKFNSEGPFSAYLGSAMCTGNPAVAMARLYNAPDWGRAADPKEVWKITKDEWEEMEDRFDSGIKLHTLPKLPWPLKQAGPGSVNPVLFVTDTSLGFKVAWSGTQGGVPDYIRLAYQRRELAYAAVTIGQEKNKETGETLLVARTPSLLATVDIALETQKFLETRVGYLQYFASGRAATALALRQDVRQAMTRRLDPEQGARMEEKDAQARNTEEAVARQDRILQWLDDGTFVDPVSLSGTEAELGARIESRNPGIPFTRGELNRELLFEWLSARGQAEDLGDVTLWLFSASDEDLDAAIRQFAME